jgi:hypothetical protein
LQEYYSAVTEPYFVEEGYLNQPFHGGDRMDYADEEFHYKYHQQSEQQTETETPKHRMIPSKLEEGEFITPNTSDEGSESDLTPTCELQIISHEGQQTQSQSSSTMDDTDNANTIIWSSETYIPNTRAHGCYLTLNSIGRLMLSLDYGSGVDSVGNTVLWNTPMPPVVPHFSDDEDKSAKPEPVSFRFYASLDNDGVIAVYRVREIVGNGKRQDGDTHKGHSTTDSESNDEDIETKLLVRPLIDKLGGMYDRLSKSSEAQGQTKAAHAWNHVRYNVGRVLAGRPWTASTVTEDHSTEDQTEPWYRPECIYSTSPVGCLAPGRNAIHITKKIARSLKRSVQSMDSHLDQFLTSLTEPASDYDYDDYNYGYFNNHDNEPSYPDFDEDEEDDILDTFIRVTGAASEKLGKAGIHAAKRGKTVAGRMVGKMKGKMKDRIGKHSIRWGERMAQNEEVDRFF